MIRVHGNLRTIIEIDGSPISRELFAVALTTIPAEDRAEFLNAYGDIIDWTEHARCVTTLKTPEEKFTLNLAPPRLPESQWDFVDSVLRFFPGGYAYICNYHIPHEDILRWDLSKFPAAEAEFIRRFLLEPQRAIDTSPAHDYYTDG